MNTRPPAFIVQSLDQARTVLMAARAFSCTPLILSTPGYAAVLGAAPFQSLINALRHEVPDTPFISAIDCGDAPGHALAALRAGVEGVVIGGNPDALHRIRDMAAQSECVIYSPEIYDGDVLAMDAKADMAALCRDFLREWDERHEA